MASVARRIFDDVTLADLGQIRRFVRESGAAAGCERAVIDELAVAVNEALANIIRHSYENKPGRIEVSVACSDETIRVVLGDDGPAFDPTTVPEPDTTLPLGERPFGGLGVHMMRDFCDALRYHRDAQGRNELTLIKSR